MRKIFTKKYKIPLYGCGIKNELKIHSLFNLLQDVAEEHVEINNTGHTYCVQNNLFWILSRYNITIFRFPTGNEKITIKTWNSELHAFCVVRDFVVYDEKKNILITAKAKYAILDRISLRPQAFKDRMPHFTAEKFVAPYKFEKIFTPDCVSTNQQVDFAVHFSELDSNDHVNNAFYPSWCLDLLDSEKSIHQICVDFKFSAVLKSKIVLQKYHKGEKDVFVVSDNDTSKVYAEVEFGF